MNYKENQQLNSIDVLILCAILSAALGIVAFFLLRSGSDGMSDRAKFHASRLSQQILTSGMARVHGEGQVDREVASAEAEPTNIELLGFDGRISRDPWGEAYHYKVFRADAKVVAVAVWSRGPDKRSDTADKDLYYDPKNNSVMGLFRGDDLGAVERVSN